MCALCGVLGIEHHWSASSGSDEQSVDAQTRRTERRKRIAAVNRLLGLSGLKLGDWQGTAYVLSTPTGRTEIIDNLGQLWPMVEDLVGNRADPLSPSLLDHLSDEQ
ncbi:MAG: hypothetical protein ACR2QJ_14995 [Geminicoccaceae bacterium]